MLSFAFNLVLFTLLRWQDLFRFVSFAIQICCCWQLLLLWIFFKLSLNWLWSVLFLAHCVCVSREKTGRKCCLKSWSMNNKIEKGKNQIVLQKIETLKKRIYFTSHGFVPQIFYFFYCIDYIFLVFSTPIISNTEHKIVFTIAEFCHS